jgi:large subunit ribosomal protein L24
MKMAKAVKTQNKKFRLRKGDKVKVIAGRDKGKEGEILKVIRESDRVVVSGINMVKRHQKPGVQGAGGIIDKELSIHISNVSAIDPKSGEATKIGFKVLKDGNKSRVARKSGETLA